MVAGFHSLTLAVIPGTWVLRAMRQEGARWTTREMLREEKSFSEEQVTSREG